MFLVNLINYVECKSNKSVYWGPVHTILFFHWNHNISAEVWLFVYTTKTIVFSETETAWIQISEWEFLEMPGIGAKSCMSGSEVGFWRSASTL